jgi:hypothetical protein
MFARLLAGLFGSNGTPSRDGAARNGNRTILRMETLDDRIAPSSTSTWAVVGDWNGDGIKTPGAVHRFNNELRWYLRNSHSSGGPDIPAFNYGGGDFPMQPVVGDWNGDGVDTIGVVVRFPTSIGFVMFWFLRDANGPGAPTVPAFAFGGGDQFWTPVVGDWDGNGTDTVGAVLSAGGVMRWHLRNSNSPGPPDIGPFAYGGAAFDAFGRPFWQPIVGDWNGDGITTIGAIFRDINGGTVSIWHLRNSNTPGGADGGAFAYGAWNNDFVAGDWNGDRITTIGAIDFLSRWYLRNSNTPGPPTLPIFVYDGSIGGFFP